MIFNPELFIFSVQSSRIVFLQHFLGGNRLNGRGRRAFEQHQFRGYDLPTPLRGGERCLSCPWDVSSTWWMFSFLQRESIGAAVVSNIWSKKKNGPQQFELWKMWPSKAWIILQELFHFRFDGQFGWVYLESMGIFSLHDFWNMIGWRRKLTLIDSKLKRNQLCYFNLQMQIASHSKCLCNNSTWFWCHWVWGCCCKPVPHPPFPPQDARPRRSCTRNFPTCLTQCPRWLQWTTLWSWMVALQGQSLWSTLRGAPIRRPVALEDRARFSWFFLWKKGTLGYYRVFFDCQVRTPISFFFFERQHTGAAEWKAVSISPPFKALNPPRTWKLYGTNVIP